MAERPVRLGWERTVWLAVGGAIGAVAGVLVTAWFIHVAVPKE